MGTKIRAGIAGFRFWFPGSDFYFSTVFGIVES